MKKILILGATSAIATASARLWAARGDRLYLVARNEAQLQRLAADLKIRGALDVQYSVLDLNDFMKQEQVISAAIQAMDGFDIALIAHGLLPDPVACENDVKNLCDVFNTNTLSPITLLMSLAKVVEKQQHGTLAVISSVAGDRIRRSNYVYGTTKAAITLFLCGLKQRLSFSKGHVVVIKPGFIDTPMTTNFKKGLLWSTPEAIAPRIVQAIDANQPEVYTPRYWFWIMQIIKYMPQGLLNKLNL